MRQARTRTRFPLLVAVCGALTLALASCESINLSKSNDEKKAAAAKQKAKKKINVPFGNQLDPVEREMVEDIQRTTEEDAEAGHSKVFGL